jgi:hypothetical protein
MRSSALVSVAFVTFSIMAGCRSTAGKALGVTAAASMVAGNALIFTAEDPAGSSPRVLSGCLVITAGTIALLAAMIVDHEPSSYGSWESVTEGGATTPAEAAHARYGGGDFYDATGARAGSVDQNGDIRDASGVRIGHVDDTGTYRDGVGAHAGSIDTSGAIHGADGSRAGSIDSQGTLRDASGQRVGYIDASGAIYDANGARAGQVAGDCDDECRRVTAGRLLLLD